ncbi:MAG: sulfate ABC transporter permease subunit CysT [Planctomycetes bacterium]|nr:sulfate ABC transporter permease subunit CysT [Planctomycetota bacterium]
MHPTAYAVGLTMARKHKSVLPGFGLSLGFTLFYLSLAVLLPMAALALKAASVSLDDIGRTLGSERVQAALWLSLRTAFIAGVINVVFGLLVAWVLERYNFPGRRLLDAFVDLPFALPTAVAGIALTALYSPNGWLGSIAGIAGIKVVYTELGIIVALTFIGLPFVVRTVQPVLQDLDAEIEEAAASLGATPYQTFRYIILPHVTPALITGFTLAFARALGEYGSVVFISGNLPGKTEIAPLAIMTKLEQYDYNGAVVIAALLLVVSLIILFIINGLQAWGRKRKLA